MSRNQRIALLGLAAVVLVVAFVIARSSGDEDSEDSTQARTTATTPASTTADTQPSDEDVPPAETDSAQTEEPAEPQVPTIRVRDGKPVGGVEELRFQKDEQIAFDVRSNQTTEIHVHGYDITKVVPGGGVARFRFKATIEGIVEVEDHGTGELIAELEVRPS
jgi:hypothetical protein